MKYYSTVKNNELLTHDIQEMYLKNIILNKKKGDIKVYAWYDLIYLKLRNEQQQKIYGSTNQKACASRNGELLTGKRNKYGKILYLDLDGVIQVQTILKMHQNVLL